MESANSIEGKENMKIKVTKKAAKKKSIRAKLRVKRSFKPILKKIVAFLNVGDEQSTYLWDILSALRGPDHDHAIHAKEATTAVVRYAIGLDDIHFTRAIVNPDTTDFVNRRVTGTGKYPISNVRSATSNHFIRHQSNAFTALGLSWDSLNYIKIK